MKAISVLIFSSALMIAVAGPAAATGDWKKRICEHLKDQLQTTLVAYENGGSFDRSYVYRHHYLKHRHRMLLRRIKYYCKVYHDDVDNSPDHNNTGYRWSKRWAALHH